MYNFQRQQLRQCSDSAHQTDKTLSAINRNSNENNNTIEVIAFVSEVKGGVNGAVHSVFQDGVERGLANKAFEPDIMNSNKIEHNTYL